jgi:hypothetical protein
MLANAVRTHDSEEGKAPPLERAAALREAFHCYLSPEHGFLPSCVPLDTVPEPFRVFRDTCIELPHRYNVYEEGASVRPWLESLFGEWDPALTEHVEALEGMELDTLMTCASILAHAYRWEVMPPRQANYYLKHIDLPEGLLVPWTIMARKLEVPRVGNTFHVVLNNWKLKTRRAGSEYAVTDLKDENLDILFTWLLPPVASELRAFMLTATETEARGVPVMRSLIRLVGAAAEGNSAEVVTRLEQLNEELDRMSLVFATYMRLRNMTPDHFLTVVQPTFIWGFDDGEGRLEGPSAPQLGIFQSIDSVFGIRFASPMGELTRHSRRYMPKRHRQFMSYMDQITDIVPGFVLASKDPRMTGAFNGCIKSMQRWRNIHKQRAAMYMKGGPETVGRQYFSSGLVVDDSGDRLTLFESKMNERIQETAERLIPMGPAATSCLTPPASMQQHAAKGATEPSGSSEKSGFVGGCPFGGAAAGGGNV